MKYKLEVSKQMYVIVYRYMDNVLDGNVEKKQSNETSLEWSHC